MLKQMVRLRVAYGVGAEVDADVPRERVVGRSATELIREAIRQPNGNGVQHRMASVLRDMLDRGRAFDVQVTRKPRAAGQPEELLGSSHIPVPSSTDDREDVEELSIRCSEAFVGGLAA
jgi:hypothetical protein